MVTDRESQRLQEVYQGYKDQGISRRRWSMANAGNRAMAAERHHRLLELLQTHGFVPLANRAILDIGCGHGNVLADFVSWGAKPKNLFGIDLLPDRIDVAKRQFGEINFQTGNAEQLPFPDRFFDLTLLFTVFTSIFAEVMAENIAQEVNRVLKSGGAVVWYDFRYNNPNNPNVHGMTKRMIRGLFPHFTLHLHRITLLPPLARGLGPLTGLLYPVLAAIPWLRTHYVGLLVKP